MIKDKTTYIPIGILTGITLLAGAALASAGVQAVDIGTCTTTDGAVTCTGTGTTPKSAGTSATASVTVTSACTMDGTVKTAHTASANSNSYTPNIGETEVKVICNDASGFAVYAVGFTGDEEGTTTLVGANTGATIATGLTADGSASAWAMKLTAGTGTYAPTIATGFNAYHVVPDEYTKVVSRSSGTDNTAGSTFSTTYAVSVSGTQPADTYQGKVKYVMVHPEGATAPGGGVNNQH